jgi:hypothetical protein
MGGPLSQKTGCLLVERGVKLSSVYGGTEFGAPTRFYCGPDRSPEDWSWFSFIDSVNPRFISQGDGLYECQFLVSHTCLCRKRVSRWLQTTPNHQPSIENLEDTRGYATSDLFEKHPSKAGLWRMYVEMHHWI